MAGTVHIFRRNVVNGPALYQVNFTKDSHTFAKVLEGEDGLHYFLIHAMALAPSAIDSIWDQLKTGSAILEGVEISGNEAMANGMITGPSDF